VLDIGGQDSKVIAIGDNGRVHRFEMNDRCAAGTGKFMEVMARTLGYAIEEFGDEALHADSDIAISSMCTVFAESEVTSLIAKGRERREIALGLHRQRGAAGSRHGGPGGYGRRYRLYRRGGQEPLHAALLAQLLGRRILLPAEPQLAGALGAALLALESEKYQ